VKLDEARDFFEMTVARHPDLLEGCFRPFGNAETVHCDKHHDLLLSMAAMDT
jgi:hypothetical protein